MEIRAALARDLRGRPSRLPADLLAGHSSRFAVVVAGLALVAGLAIGAGMLLPPDTASFAARAGTGAVTFVALLGAVVLVIRLLPAAGGES